MALVECPECEQRLSPLASTCPTCGFPLGETETLTRRLKRIGIGYVLYFATTIIFLASAILVMVILGQSWGAGDSARCQTLLVLLAVLIAMTFSSILKYGDYRFERSDASRRLSQLKDYEEELKNPEKERQPHEAGED